DTKKWRREHPAPNRKPLEGPVFEEARAQNALHDAALLREARGEYRQALSDRALTMQLWKTSADRDEQTFAQAQLRATLGEPAFVAFRKQEIKAPLMTTLNRKIALLQTVKRRAEDTVAMRQAEPAVCALGQLGEAQILLGKALTESPFPPGLNAEQRKL